MAVSRVKTSSILQGFPKSRSLLAGNAYYVPSSYESIATSTLGSSSSFVEFLSIPSTYTHLQIRVTSLSDNATVNINLQVNSDTGTNYTWHELYGDGSAAGAGAGATQTFIKTGYTQSTTASYTGAAIIDILDYKDTNKYKTVRTLAGSDANGSGYAMLRSGVWRNTRAITSIKLTNQLGNFKQYSSFALYGIKGA